VLLSLVHVCENQSTTTTAKPPCEPFQRPPTTNSTCTKPKWSKQGVTVAGTNDTIRWLPTGLQYPMGIFIDTKHGDTLYVADKGNARIQKFVNGSPIGLTVAGGKKAGNAANLLHQVSDVFVDSSTGNIFIADYGNRRVQMWSANGSEGVTVADLDDGWPNGVYVSQQGDVYVSVDFSGEDPDPAIIMKYSSLTSPETIAIDESFSPEGLFVDHCNSVYVADSYGNRILKYSSTDDHRRGISDILVSGLGGPNDVTFDQYGNLYIVERRKNRIQRVSLRNGGSGELQLIVGDSEGQYGKDAEHLNGPTSLAFDSKHNLYVSDTLNYRVQKFMFEGGDLYC
jgi:tripartite motif-containing protein 71